MTQTIVLIKREANCKNLTEQQFIQYMFNDMLEAQENFIELSASHTVKYQLEFKLKRIQEAYDRASKYASQKWKRETNRRKYINEAVATEKKDTYLPTFNEPLFFDFKVEPDNNMISMSCGLSYRNLTFQALQNCFNSIKDNEFFRKAIGWSLEYETVDGIGVADRPHIRLIFDEKTNNDWKQSEKNLEESIMNFYKNYQFD